jgi:hypothetical protein
VVTEPNFCNLKLETSNLKPSSRPQLTPHPAPHFTPHPINMTSKVRRPPNSPNPCQLNPFVPTSLKQDWFILDNFPKTKKS